jgi:hypothetical protein
MLGVLFFSAAVFSSAMADDILLDGTTFSKQYLLEISGTVMNETFSGAQALLTVLPPDPGGTNPYLIIIDGFPQRNSRNSFFWNSNHTEMTAIANELTCDIKRTYVKPVPLYFVFLSPALLTRTIIEQDVDKEFKEAAEKVALPTLITAQSGKLKLRVHSNSVSGTIWMKGYDPVEKAYVKYSANLYGKRAYNLEPRQQTKK